MEIASDFCGNDFSYLKVNNTFSKIGAVNINFQMTIAVGMVRIAVVATQEGQIFKRIII